MNKQLFDFNSADDKQHFLNFQNHEMLNSVLFYDSQREVLSWCRKQGFNLLGFTKAPYGNGYEDFDWAMVLEDEEFNIWWIHVADFNIKNWKGDIDE